MVFARSTIHPDELEAILAGRHADPHRVLGRHRHGDGWVVRVRHPAATKASVVAAGRVMPMAATHPDGVFELALDPALGALESGYRIEWRFADGSRHSTGDPYRFLPVLGEVDRHLLGEGTHLRLWEVLGARHRTHEGVDGVAFAVWAPNARAVRVVGDWNGWDGRVHPMRNLGGVWELFVPLIGPGERYKYEIVGADGSLFLKADPMARRTECPPATASVVDGSDGFAWGDEAWMAARATQPADTVLSIYEVHLGSWRRNPLEGDRSLTYRELAGELADHVAGLGFTHVELLPVAEHPFGGSWGYQVSGYYAPTARYGSPDDFRHLVDTLHRRGIGVIVDWVPAHFPRDEFALARFDGSALYEHDDPRQGAHPDWGTLVFNFGRNEVRNFLVANALYWLEEFHLDGLRVDAVASMLYLDYSRAPGEWVANRFGGRENLEAIDFLRALNAEVRRRFDDVMIIAEESTAWPGVTRSPDDDGLGFTHKWNMGWMHDTLEYFVKDPLYRSFEHDKLTFGLLYVWNERFVSPLSHDEVVHGKRSLLDKMPGDDWQRFANLRALLGWMWAHPGKKLLFMGAEFAQQQEWSEARSLDWHLLAAARHRGVRDLVASLNALLVQHPALSAGDFGPEGFRWLDRDDRAASVLAFVRAAAGECLVCVANLTPVVRHDYRIGLPEGGDWQELLSTDEPRFGGSGVVNGRIGAEPVPWQGRPASAVITLAPLAVTFLGPARGDR